MNISTFDLLLGSCFLGSLLVTAIMAGRNFLHVLWGSVGWWKIVVVVVFAEAGALLLIALLFDHCLFCFDVSTHDGLALELAFIGWALTTLVYGAVRMVLWYVGFCLAVKEGI